MKTVVHNTPKFPFVIMEDIFDSETLSGIWKQVEYLHDEVGLREPEYTGQKQKTEDGTPWKSNSGIFIPDVYTDFTESAISVAVGKLFTTHPNLISLYQKNHLFKALKSINYVATLFNYYTDKDYYFPHIDSAVFTFVYWIFKEPKGFTGGNLMLPELNTEIEVKNNCGILFPSHAEHAVSKITALTDEKLYGRISFSTFMTIH